MKIIEVCRRTYPSYIGGIEKCVWNISRKLARKFEVEIYATNSRRRSVFETEISGLKIREFPCLALYDIYLFSPSLYKALEGVEADLVHAHGIGALSTLAAALAKPKNDLPLFVSPHFGFSKVPRVLFTMYNLSFNKLVLKRADQIIAVSPNEKSEIAKVGDFSNKILYIPNGIDVQEIDSHLNRSMQSDWPKVILYVGRLERKKGLQSLIYAFSQIVSLYDVVLLIVGEGPYKNEIIKMVSTSGIEDRVKFLGRVSENELYQIYARSHIFVSPSSYESHSMSLTEAMGFGVVPIVTNVGGNRFVVSNRENGFLVSYPVKVEEIAHLLSELVQNEDLLKIVSEGAREKAKHNFDLNKTSKSLEYAYEQCARK